VRLTGPLCLFTIAAIIGTALPQGGAVAAPAPQRPAPALLAMVRASVGSDQPDARYLHASVDLDGDGLPEALVYVVSATLCGSGGCSLQIYTPAGRSWRLVTATSVTQLPVRLLGTSHKGWRDLGVAVSGGGARGGEALLAYDGHRYPRNPTMQQRVPRGTAGRVVLAGSDQPLPLFQ
jgi:hypothetical protein